MSYYFGKRKFKIRSTKIVVMTATFLEGFLGLKVFFKPTIIKKGVEVLQKVLM